MLTLVLCWNVQIRRINVIPGWVKGCLYETCQICLEIMISVVAPVTILHTLTDGTCIQCTSVRVCFLFQQQCSSPLAINYDAGAPTALIMILMLMKQLVSPDVRLTLFRHSFIILVCTGISDILD